MIPSMVCRQLRQENWAVSLRLCGLAAVAVVECRYAKVTTEEVMMKISLFPSKIDRGEGVNR